MAIQQRERKQNNQTKQVLKKHNNMSFGLKGCLLGFPEFSSHLLNNHHMSSPSIKYNINVVKHNSLEVNLSSSREIGGTYSDIEDNDV